MLHIGCDQSLQHRIVEREARNKWRTKCILFWTKDFQSLRLESCIFFVTGYFLSFWKTIFGLVWSENLKGIGRKTENPMWNRTQRAFQSNNNGVWQKQKRNAHNKCTTRNNQSKIYYPFIRMLHGNVFVRTHNKYTNIFVASFLTLSNMFGSSLKNKQPQPLIIFISFFDAFVD